MQNPMKLLQEDKIYPIIRCADRKKSVDIAKALIDGGIRVMEINLENSSIYEAIEEVSNMAVVCAGGVITSTQASLAFNSGAKIFSSPIFQINLVKISKNIGIPFIAGASTPNEAYNAWKARVPVIKIFPTRDMGGVNYVHDILRQMPFLNLMPLGGIKLEEVSEYIKLGAIAVGVGRDFYEGYSFAEITKRAKEIKAKLSDIK